MAQEATSTGKRIRQICRFFYWKRVWVTLLRPHIRPGLVFLWLYVEVGGELIVFGSVNIEQVALLPIFSKSSVRAPLMTRVFFFFFFFCIFYPRASARLSVLDYNTSDHSGFQDERLAVKAWYFSAELLTSLVRHGFNFLKAKSFRHHCYCWAEAIWQKDLHSPNSCKYRNFSEC